MDIKNIPITAGSEVGKSSAENGFSFLDSEEKNAFTIKTPSGHTIQIPTTQVKKEIKLTISQGGTGAPTISATAVNSVGSLTLSRQAAGVYYIEKTGAFDAIVLAMTQCNQNGTNRFYDFGKFDNDKLFLRQYDENGAGIDGLFDQTIFVELYYI